MPTIEDVLSDIAADIAQLTGDVTAIGSASTTSAGLIKLSGETAPDDNSVPTVAFFKNRNILSSNGGAGGGLPQAQIDKINALPTEAALAALAALPVAQISALPPQQVLAALSALPTNFSGLEGRILAVNSTGDGFEIVVAPSGGGGGSGAVTIVVDRFTGDGSTTAFTLSQTAINSVSLDVTVSGITIDPAIYNVSGTTLTFNDAPPVTSVDEILVRHLAAEATIGVPGNNTITLAKLANGTPGKFIGFDNSTGVAEEKDIVVPDNSVSTTKIINKNVTLSKLADGTPGRILKFNDSTGVIEEVDVAALSSGMVHVLRATIPGSIAQLDIENASLFDGTYKQLLVIGSGIRPVVQSSSGHVYCRVKTQGVYRADNNYRSSGHDAPNNGGHNIYQDNSAILIVPQWSGNSHWFDFTTTITNPAATGLPRPTFMTLGNETNDGGQSGNSTTAGVYETSNTLPLQGLRFFFAGQNMLAGNIDIYGLR